VTRPSRAYGTIHQTGRHPDKLQRTHVLVTGAAGGIGATSECALGPVTIAVANVGIDPNRPARTWGSIRTALSSRYPEEWDRVIGRNMRGVFLTCQARNDRMDPPLGALEGGGRPARLPTQRRRKSWGRSRLTTCAVPTARPMVAAPLPRASRSAA
jgi:NAD(P)-dependent dehydrogenase (short-subunit alcohol dehydrogenase family)